MPTVPPPTARSQLHTRKLGRSAPRPRANGPSNRSSSSCAPSFINAGCQTERLAPWWPQGSAVEIMMAHRLSHGKSPVRTNETGRHLNWKFPSESAVGKPGLDCRWRRPPSPTSGASHSDILGQRMNQIRHLSDFRSVKSAFATDKNKK